MSWPALGWASKQKPGRVADKMVLIALADRHNEESDVAYPSIAWLAEFSCLDRKTVVAALGRLESAGLIADSGQRVGRTGQIKAYRLALNSTEKGDPKTELLKPKSTTFSVKESQKRDTEPFKEPDLPSGKSKTRETVPKPQDVSDSTWRDFKRQRKKPITDTALRGIKREADKAGWPLEDALVEATERSWESFKAKWVKDRDGNKFQNSSSASKSAGNDEIQNPIVREVARREAARASAVQ